jgi:hypothetical protein
VKGNVILEFVFDPARSTARTGLLAYPGGVRGKGASMKAPADRHNALLSLHTIIYFDQ